MKLPFLPLLAFILGFALSARAQTAGESYSADQLDQLLAPIALYPDPLVALILPASTVPSDLALAASYLAANGDPAGIDAQPWDPSVKGLAHYPEVVAWMNGNLDWTEALGAAFAQQPTDVMKSIQQLRTKAWADGSLVSTPQQTVVFEGDEIRIVPTDANAIYVPEYDPNVVYDPVPGVAGPFLQFGTGYPVGDWLGYECDWDDYGIWIGTWVPGWEYRREWRGSFVYGRDAGRAWRPDPARAREVIRNAPRPGSRLPSPGIASGFRGPVRPAGAAPVAVVPRASSAPDFRGREAPAPRMAAPAAPPASSLFGGYSRGSQTRDFSSRGQVSRAAPVRSMPAPREEAPSHESAPSRAPSGGGGDRRGN
jgi:hypothetical protein